MIPFEAHIEGVAPLLMHNSQLSDPLNEWAKEIGKYTKKGKNKTDEDHLKIAELEWHGGLWLVNGKIGIPAENQHAMIWEGAKIIKLGKKVQAGLYITEGAPLIYKGPKEPKAAWADGSFTFRKMMKQAGRRIARTRAIFREWALELRGHIDVDKIDPDQFEAAMGHAAHLCGLGDSRPRYGRFIVKRVKVGP